MDPADIIGLIGALLAAALGSPLVLYLLQRRHLVNGGVSAATHAARAQEAAERSASAAERSASAALDAKSAALDAKSAALTAASAAERTETAVQNLLTRKLTA